MNKLLKEKLEELKESSDIDYDLEQAEKEYWSLFVEYWSGPYTGLLDDEELAEWWLNLCEDPESLYDVETMNEIKDEIQDRLLSDTNWGDVMFKELKKITNEVIAEYRQKIDGYNDND